jgi:hypothetical protein
MEDLMLSFASLAIFELHFGSPSSPHVVPALHFSSGQTPTALLHVIRIHGKSL